MRQTKPDERANGIENVKYFSFGMFKRMPIYSAGSGFKIKLQPQSFVAFNFYYWNYLWIGYIWNELKCRGEDDERGEHANEKILADNINVLF